MGHALGDKAKATLFPTAAWALDERSDIGDLCPVTHVQTNNGVTLCLVDVLSTGSSVVCAHQNYVAAPLPRER